MDFRKNWFKYFSVCLVGGIVMGTSCEKGYYAQFSTSLTSCDGIDSIKAHDFKDENVHFISTNIDLKCRRSYTYLANNMKDPAKDQYLTLRLNRDPEGKCSASLYFQYPAREPHEKNSDRISADAKVFIPKILESVGLRNSGDITQNLEAGSLEEIRKGCSKD